MPILRGLKYNHFPAQVYMLHAWVVCPSGDSRLANERRKTLGFHVVHNEGSKNKLETTTFLEGVYRVLCRPLPPFIGDHEQAAPYGWNPKP